MQNHTDCILDLESQVPHVKFKKWQDDPHMKHCFTTKLGGVSEGEWASLNLGFNRGDGEGNVLENYQDSILAASPNGNVECVPLLSSITVVLSSILNSVYPNKSPPSDNT